MLTVEQLKEMQQNEIFATGIVLDNPDGVNMTNSGKTLRWIAQRGRIHDWTIYCHWAEHSVGYIAMSGDKVCSPNHIKKLVPCDDEAYAMYRL